MSVGAHEVHDRRIGTIQVDENVACVLVSGVGLQVDVASFAVASAQKADGRRIRQLNRRPKSFSGKRAARQVVNQTDQVQFVGHRRQMATDGLPGQKESTVVHDRNCAIEATRRTMNPQRTANSVLTVCLTSGGRFTHCLPHALHRISAHTRQETGKDPVLLAHGFPWPECKTKESELHMRKDFSTVAVLTVHDL
jgi:hypothetical protein